MTANLATALSAFQAEMPHVGKGKTAKVPMKAGGSYSYKYADLADITAAAMPVLTKHGLAFSCAPRQAEGTYELVGTLLHSSGERLDGALPIRGGTPQEIGSALTYMRRYLFGCLTGLVTDEDDDGAAASKPKRQAAAPQPASLQEPKAGNEASPKQVAMIGAIMRDLGLTEREDALKYVADVIGRTVASRNDLTAREASAVIDALQKEGQPV